MTYYQTIYCSRSIATTGYYCHLALYQIRYFTVDRNLLHLLILSVVIAMAVAYCLLSLWLGLVLI